MAYIPLVICLLLSSCVIVESQDVACFNDERCSDGDSIEASIDNCCLNAFDPPGLGYSVPGGEGCDVCPKIFGFFDTTFSGVERGDAFSVQFGTISGRPLSFIRVRFSLQLDTASSSDVELSTTNVDLFTSTANQSVSFTLTKDSISQEGNEVFRVTAVPQEPFNLDGYETRLNLTVTILDDDIVVFRFSETDYRENEMPNAMMPVKITKAQNVMLANPVIFNIIPMTVAEALSRGIELDNRTVMNTPDSPLQAIDADFDTSTFNVVFPADEASSIVPDIDAFISVVDDEIDENEEQVFIVLLEVVEATNIALVSNTGRNVAVCRIIDNDPLVIGFEQESYTVIEPQRLVLLTSVFLVKENDRQSEQTFTVGVGVGNPSTVGMAVINAATVGRSGGDFDIPGGVNANRFLTLLFQPNVQRVRYSIFLVPDNTAEGTEGFLAISSPNEGSVTYTTPTGASSVFRSTTVIIEDDDLVEVEFERTQYTVNESAGVQEICINITNPPTTEPLGFTLILTYTTVIGSADEDDYVAVSSSTIIFLAGPGNILNSRRVCVDIVIIGDDALEDTEMFTVILTPVESGVLVDPNTTEITIVDNDDAIIGFIETFYTANEADGIATVQIGVISGSIGRDVALLISLMDGSALLSSDYLDDVDDNGMIVLNAENPVLNVTFSLVDDLVYEFLESLSVSLSLVGAAIPRLILNPTSAEITILDDDVLVFAFMPSEYTVAEDVGSVSLAVELTIGVLEGLVVTVSAATNDESATAIAGLDYTPVDSVSLDFSSANSQQTFDVDILEDPLTEQTEFFFARLTGYTVAVGGSQVSLTPEERSRIQSMSSSQIFIIDDDVTILGFTPAVYIAGEDAGTIEFTFGVLEGELGSIVVLQFFTTDGIATSSFDYEEVNRVDNLTFPFSGTELRTTSVTIIDDDSFEDVERFFGNLNFIVDDIPSGITLMPSIASADIFDNDEAIIGFIETSYTVNEADGSVTLQIGAISGIIGQDVSLLISFSDGSALLSSDYLDNFGDNGVIVLTDDNPALNVSFSLVDDLVYEFLESFSANLSFSGAAVPRLNLAPTSADITILDDDVLVFAFMPSEYTVAEDVGSVSLAVELTRGVLEGLVVTVSAATNDESATAIAGLDYTPVDSVSLDFSSANSQQTFDVDILEDPLTEQTEFFFARLTGYTVAVGGSQVSLTPEERSRIQSMSSSQIFIIDDDETILGFRPEEYSVNEDDGTVTFNFGVLEGELTFGVTLEFFTSDGTAISAVDYIDITELFIILGKPMLNTTVEIIDDSFLENAETFFGNLRITSTPDNVILRPVLASAEIIDNDEAVIGFDPTSYTVDESGNEVIFNIVLMSGILTIDVEIEFSTADAGAQGSEDYTSVTRTLTFNATQSFNLVSVPILNDELLELDEVFNGNLELLTQVAVLLVPASATGTIIDDDEVVIGFIDNYEVTEGVNSSVSIELGVISGMLGRDVVVSVSTQDASASAPGDYMAILSRLVTFTPTQLAVSIDVGIVNDDIFEDLTEEFTAIATLASTADTGVNIDPITSVITIVDNEVINIGFDQTFYDVVENEGLVNVTIVLDGRIDVEILITLSTGDGSAVSFGSEPDFVSTTRVLTFSPSSSAVQTIVVPITIIDDGLVESVESFNEVLTLTTTSDAIILQPSQASIMIIDDDAVVIGFEQTRYSIDETVGTVEVNISIISGDLRIPVEVTFTTADATAVDGSDYEGLTTTLTFDESTTSFIVILTIIDDDVHERVESFLGQLSSSVNSDVVMLNPASTTILIMDNEVVTFTFRDPVQTVFENVSEVTVFIDRAGITAEDFTLMVTGPLQLETNMSIDTMVSITSMDSEATVTFTVVDDLVALEETEVLMWTLTLITMINGASISPFDTTEIRIVDDDVLVIGFDPEAYTVNEGAGFVEVNIVLIGRTAQNILISLATTDGSAVSSGDEADYVSTTLVLTFSLSGNDIQTMFIQIPIIDDNLVEFSESFNAVLTLVTSDPAITLERSEASIDIIDNDVVVIGFDPSTVSVSEDENSVDVTILVLSGELRIPSVVVTFTTADNTALDGSDYSGLTQTLTFDQISTSFTISVPILNNDIHEFNEDFFGLLTTSESSDIVTLDPASATIEILDDDVVTFSFRESVQTVVESIGDVTVYIDRSGTTDETIILMVTGLLQEETNMTIDREITFSPTDFEISITFDVIDDSIALEPTESLLWTLTLVTMGNGASITPFDTSDVRIVDDDELVLQLTKRSSRVPESENTEACISFSNAFAVNFNIDVSTIFSSNVTVEGIATPGTDFIIPDSPILAEANVNGPPTDLCFDLNIVDDNAVEVEECFSVSISLPSPETDDLLVTIDDDSDTSLCCIVDNDVVVIGFLPDTYTVLENANSTTLTIAILSGTLERPVEVFFFTSDGTATSIAPLDYNSLTDVPLQFDASTSSRQVIVTIVDDDILENPEMFFGNLRTNDDDVDVEDQQAIVTILEADGDQVTVGFEPEDYAVNEIDGAVLLTAVLIAGILEREVTVQFSTVAGSATETDFEATTFDLTFSSTTSQVVIAVEINDDTAVEGSETFFGTLQDQGTPSTVITNPDRATVVITEDLDDRVSIGFEQTIYSVVEGLSIEVCIIITSGTLERDAEVTIFTSDLTAISGEDYESFTVAITFTAEFSRICSLVTTVDNDIDEDQENFTLTLASDDSMVVVNPDIATVIISDDDQIIIGFEETTFSVTEVDDAFVEVCAALLNGVLRRNIEIDLVTLDGTALEPGDYTPVNVVLTFTPELSIICVNVSIENDDNSEELEDFQVELSTMEDRVEVEPGTAQITIEDNDGIEIGFETTVFFVTEADGAFVEVCAIVVSGVLERNAEVQLMTSDGAAVEPGDYTPVDVTLTFTPTNNRLCHNISIGNDDAFEGPEYFQVQLSTVDDRVDLMPDTAIITIEEDNVDGVTIGFTEIRFSVTEADGAFVEVCATLFSGELERNVEVDLVTSDGSAQAPGDYNAVSVVLTFSPTESLICSNVSIANDIAYEDPEQFVLMLRNMGLGVVLDPFTAVVTIEEDDNDGVTIGLEETTFSVTEGDGPVEVCAAVLGGVLEKNVEIVLATSNDGAVAPGDYTAVVNMVLTFTPTETRLCVDINIGVDGAYEDPEDFLVDLSTMDGRVTLAPDSARVTITDNDVITIGFVIELDSVMENTPGFIDLFVGVINGGTLERSVVVSYQTIVSTAANAATSGSDFLPVSGDLTFTPVDQDIQLSFGVGINDDTLSEGLEVFLAQLTTEQDRVILAPNEMTIEIVDDDVITVGFINLPYSGSETEGFATLVVSVLSGNLIRDLVIILVTDDVTGGAIAPMDYTPLNEQLTFNAEVGTIDVNVTLIDDDLFEGDEIFQGRLSFEITGTSNVLNTPVADVTILDNDRITIGLEQTTFTVTEGDDAFVEVCASVIDGELGANVEVNLVTSDATAVASGDYTAVNVVLTLTPMGTRACFNISIENDDAYEDTEYFMVGISTAVIGVDLIPDAATITIEEDNEDGVTIGFEEIVYLVTEGVDASLEVCAAVLIGDLEKGVVIQLGTSDATAMTPSDYAALVDVGLTFTPMVTRVCVIISIGDDVAYENPEYFQVELSTTDARVELAPDSAQVIITDNDGITIGLEQTSYFVTEKDDAFVEVCAALLSGTLGSNAVVYLVTLDGIAEAPGDYTAINVTLTFTPTENRDCFNVQIINDDNYEELENFEVMLRTMNDLINLDPNTALITIEDDEEITIGFVTVMDTVFENTPGFIDLFLRVLSGGMLQRSIVVSYSTGLSNAANAASSVSDFEPAVGELTFTSANQNMALYFRVNITDDSAPEETEVFLGILATTQERVTIEPNQMTVGIIDDDVPTIGFIDPPYSALETEEIVTLTVGLVSGNIDDIELVVRFVTEDLPNGATQSIDYEPVDELLLTFNILSTTVEVNVTIINDDLFEGDEIFLGQLTLLTTGVLAAVSPAVTDVTILDDDRITIGLDETTFTVIEMDGAFVEVCASLLSGELVSNAEVLLATIDGTAEAPEDYTALFEVILTFTPMERRICVNVSIENDVNYEEQENFEVVLVPTNELIDLVPNTAVITIEDEDVITIGFVVETDTVMENTPGFIDLFLSVLNGGMLQRPIVVSYSTELSSAANAASSVSDFEPAVGELTFTSANQNMALYFRVNITDDNAPEETEEFLGMLTTTQERVMISPDEMTVEIIDDDVPTIGFINPPYSALETDGVVTLIVGLISGNIDGIELVVRFVTEDLSDGATRSIDYEPVDELLLTFNILSTTVEVNVTIINDDLFEGDEIFLGQLTLLTTGVLAAVSPAITDVTILDDDRITIGLDQTTFTVIEMDGAFVEVCASLLSGELVSNAEVLLATIDGTAEASDDYTSLDVVLTFTSTESRICTNVSIENNADYEVPEDFVVELSTMGALIDLVPNSAQITILDEDVITIGFVIETATVMENTPGFIDLFLRVQNGGTLESSIVVSYSTVVSSAANAASIDEDFQPAAGELTFTPANQDMALFFRVNITDDEVPEISEQFLAQLSTDQDGVLLAPNEMIIVIEDNDVPTIGFINPPYSALETDEVVTLTVGLVSGNLDGSDLVVRLVTEDIPDGATEFLDYTPITVLLTFNDQQITMIEVDVILINDTAFEGDEIFQGKLSIETVGAIAAVGPSVADVTILDDDVITIGLNVERVTVDEGVGMVELCATAVGDLETEVVVSVAYQDRGAVGDDDYEVNVVLLTFSPGMLQDCFNVTIIDDDLYENPEEFFANITTTDPLVIISPMTTVVTILDNDVIVIGWEFTGYTLFESAGPIEICAVIQSGILTVTIPAINILLADGSAVRGEDYVDPPSSTFFAFSSTSGDRLCIMVDIVADGLFEIDIENFFANLGLASNVPRVFIDPMQTEIEIIDQDVVVIGFTPASYNVGEGDGSVDLVFAVISGILSIDAPVMFTTSDDLAIANQDYNTLAIILTFSSSVTSQLVTIIINEDDIDENAELFNGILSSTNSRIQLAPAEADIVIIDNDQVTIGFERTLYITMENDTRTTEVCAIAFSPPTLGREIVVTIETEDGTATAPYDYSVISMVVTFDQDNLRRCIQITIPDDGIEEGTERLNVRLSSNSSEIFDPVMAIVEIEGIDGILVRFDLPSYTFNENDGTVSITVVKVGDRNELFTVRVTGGPSTQVNVINSAPAIDVNITFGMGDNPPDSIPISLTLIDDEIGLEDIETYTATLEILSGTIVMLGTPDQTTINVIDDDDVTVSIETPSIRVPESFGTFNVCIVKNRRTVVPVTVDLNVQAGSATRGDDFTDGDIPTSFTIPAGDLRACFTSTAIIDDSDPREPDESFTIRITPENPNVNIGTTNTIEIIITDNGVPTIRFEFPTYSFSEQVGTGDVCLIKNIMTNESITIDGISTSDISTTVRSDYIGGPFSVTFGQSAGDRQCITITILTDSESEDLESFTITLNLDGNDLVQPGNPSITTVTIEDVGILVNDTVMGDPLYTVPILVSDEQLDTMNTDKLSLCYEVHGEAGNWFNLVTDECASVNTRYTSLSDRFNIMDSIGVRAVDNANQCINVGVDANECAATVNGANLASMGRYSTEGVNVRRYSNRVRISVPNCAELTLVMWVICEPRALVDPDQPGMVITGNMVQFVVMRGLNFGHRLAHGLLGQFWNIPVDITPFTGVLLNGNATDAFVVSITTAGTQRRSYIGFLHQSTWDHTEEPCLYVGNRQSGPIGEVNNPNGSVTASIYTDYKVPGPYSEEGYRFGLFAEGRCSLLPTPP